jgi:AcrR family transcriptional regulator
MTSDEDETGRFRQRRRTRESIVAATMGLLRSGATPSVAEIATAADMSRRTIYLHFPTLEQLLVDATLGMLSEHAIEEAIDAADVGDEAEARVAAMITAIGAQSSETLPLGRSLIRLTIDVDDGPQSGVPRRGYRRIAWIERAIRPLRDRLDDAQFERLVSGLAMVIGWEAFVVLQDLRALDHDDQIEVSLWAARALIRATLEDAARSPLL